MNDNNIPLIQCQQTNHDCMPFQYICLKKQCLKFNQNPLCFHCLKSSHEDHIQQTISLIHFVNQCIKISQPKIKNFQFQTNGDHKDYFKLQNILLKGLPNCKNKVQLKGILQQIYKATFNSSSRKERKEQILNQQVEQLKSQAQKFYVSSKSHYTSNKLAQKTNKKRSLTSDTQFTIPVLSFTSNNQIISSQNFSRVSPFQIKHNKSTTISSILAYPSLSTLNQSTQAYIKVLRLSPNWMGLGISIGQNNYEQTSKNHITLLSNGWINERGNLLKFNNLKFKTGQTIKICWDKNKKQLIFRNTTTKYEQVIKFCPEWNQQVFLCVIMFFKDDRIAIVQAQNQ